MLFGNIRMLERIYLENIYNLEFKDSIISHLILIEEIQNL